MRSKIRAYCDLSSTQQPQSSVARSASGLMSAPPSKFAHTRSSVYTYYIIHEPVYDHYSRSCHWWGTLAATNWDLGDVIASSYWHIESAALVFLALKDSLGLVLLFFPNLGDAKWGITLHTHTSAHTLSSSSSLSLSLGTGNWTFFVVLSSVSFSWPCCSLEFFVPNPPPSSFLFFFLSCLVSTLTQPARFLPLFYFFSFFYMVQLV